MRAHKNQGYYTDMKQRLQSFRQGTLAEIRDLLLRQETSRELEEIEKGA
jgi:hypothetical protein